MKIDSKKIRLAMAQAGINGKELQILSGVPKGTMSNIFTRGSARSETAGKIAKALNVPVTAILADEEIQHLGVPEEAPLHTLTEEQLDRKVELLLRYTELGVRLSGFHMLNQEWKPEYDIEIQIIRQEMLEIRKKLGMENRR